MKTNIEVVRQALEHIDANLGDKITFVSVAGRFHYSPYFFDRVFQRITGSTITEYVREQRLLTAASMLRSGRTVTDIGLECGFASSQAFSRAFRQRFGRPPGAFRKAGAAAEPRRPDELIGAYLDRLKGEQREMTPKLIELDEMLIAGVAGDGCRTGEVWDEYMALEAADPLPDRVSQDGYEIRFYPEGRCDILVGIQVERPPKSERYSTYRLPGGTYAAFDILLANGWEHNNRLMDRWLEDNSAVYAQRRDERTGACYAIEVYDDRFFGMDNLDSVIVMWVPLIKN